jgi:hypothetical protein
VERGISAVSERTARILLVGVLLTGASHAAESPFAKCHDIKPSFWDGVAAAFGAGPDLKDACIKGVQDGLEMRSRQAEIERLEAEKELRAATARTKSMLTDLWIETGLPAESARAIAETYVPSDATEAIIVNVRARGWESVRPGIENALDNYNYLLANQLLLAGMVVKAEEDAAAVDHGVANTPKPSEPSAQGSTMPQKADDQ